MMPYVDVEIKGEPTTGKTTSVMVGGVRFTHEHVEGETRDSLCDALIRQINAAFPLHVMISGQVPTVFPFACGVFKKDSFGFRSDRDDTMPAIDFSTNDKNLSLKQIVG